MHFACNIILYNNLDIYIHEICQYIYKDILSYKYVYCRYMGIINIDHDHTTHGTITSLHIWSDQDQN